MIPGLLRKTFVETWTQTLGFGAALAAITALLTQLLPQLQQGLNEFLSAMPFVREIFQALLGSTLGDQINPQALQAIVWVHPTVLAVLWAHAIVVGTRFPAGEIDRGTIDVLLSWPASRRKIFLCDAAVSWASGVWLMVMALAGHLLAVDDAPQSGAPSLPRLVVVLLNLYCVYLAVSGLAYLASAVSNRRGRAVGAVFSVVVASFLVSFLAQFWPPAEQLAPVCLLSYYQPAEILASGHGPLGDMALLAGTGLLSLTAACEIFARRNICTL